MVIYPDLADGASPGSLLVLTPVYSNLAAIFMEGITTFILVFTVFRTAVGVREPHFTSGMDAKQVKAVRNIKRQVWMKKNFAPVAIGFTLGYLSFPSSYISGGGYNPSRALAGCVVGTDCSAIWVYFLGEFIGGGLAGLFHYWFMELPHEHYDNDVDTYDEDAFGL